MEGDALDNNGCKIKRKRVEAVGSDGLVLHIEACSLGE